MPEHGVRSTYSQAPVQILSCDSGGIIGSATGFFYEADGERFFVTNWHVVSGRDFLSKDIIDKNNARIPTWLEIKTAKWITPHTSEPRQFTTVARRLDLYSDPSGPFEPLWYEHPTFGSDCDVVAIPCNRVSDEPTFMHNEVNNISKRKIPIKPGQPAFVIGFPSSISTGFGLPIWKTVYIASELTCH